jgi:patatin-like phospholipase/acyl hydrolase
LERLAAAIPGLLARTDLIAGTSTGGILALALAAGKTPTDLVELYQQHGDDIFHDSFGDNVRDLGKTIGADYNQRGLKRHLERELGRDRRLADLAKRVLIPTFDLDNRDNPGFKQEDHVRSWKPKFFHNFPSEDSDGQESVVDVALRTSAAPTYFPSYEGYIDGGVVANNPSMAALAQALDTDTGQQELDSIRLLSVGTGSVPAWIGGRSHDWGYAQWSTKLTSLMLDGLMGVADYQCKRLLGDRYHRLDTQLKTRIDLDDAAKVPLLIRYADVLVIEEEGGVLEWLEHWWR